MASSLETKVAAEPVIEEGKRWNGGNQLPFEKELTWNVHTTFAHTFQLYDWIQSYNSGLAQRKLRNTAFN